MVVRRLARVGNGWGCDDETSVWNESVMVGCMAKGRRDETKGEEDGGMIVVMVPAEHQL